MRLYRFLGGPSVCVLSLAKGGAAFSLATLALTRKWRDELAGGQIIQGAEAAAKFGVAQAAVAVERAYKFHGVALCLQ